MNPVPPRRTRPEGDVGSMAMFLTIAVVGLAIAALLVPMVVSSSRTTRSDTSRVHALDAAQSGVNVMVGEIRASQTGSVGTSTMLPCGQRSGVVNSEGPAAYSVAVDYYVADPVSTPGAQPMTCVQGYGTYDPVSEAFTPKFARITSTGTDGPAVNGSTPGRKLVTTYVFRTTNSNIVGGRIRVAPPAGATAEMCMDAGSANPIAGVVVTLKPCATPPQDQQLFAYRNDLTIQLVSSANGTYAQGVCLDTADPPTAGRIVTLTQCAAIDPPPYTQQWSYNDNGGYTASTAASRTTGTLSNQCLATPNQNPGVQLVLAGCGSGGNLQAWIPSPAVGPGAADAPQFVNFSEFGRCLDVTNQNPASDHLIDYPCKQNPFPGAVAWNQKFAVPDPGDSSAAGRIVTTRAGIDYCLTSPGTNLAYVTVSPCSATNPRQTWTRFGGGSTLAYSAKYTIVDNGSRCLGLTDPKAGELWSAIDVEPCTGATEQKWNATADLARAVFQDLDEVRP